ncbi:MAG: BlaI/MecI/CopY family transcriptional regulator [Bacteroidia bacterium]|nr:BlaI/MecI/CopY family transcriptional regulator [Bacteroidia bacterium]
MQKLTRAEEEVMQVIWDLEKGLLKDIMQAMPEPRPSQSTVSTVIRILETKGFVDHKAYGKTFEYFPIVQKEDYARAYMGNFIQNYFNGSFKQMLSFFVEEKDIDLKTLNELMKMAKEQEDNP